MARGHGRILTSIWEDADFLDLEEREQRLYLFLISQPNLNHAGLLDLTLRRWARKARSLLSADLEKLLQNLEAARFIVMDEDTEELLIRSFIRNDGVWRMPKVMGAAVSGALEISSKKLQQALLVEMDRVPLDELSDEPAKLRNGSEGPSIRQQVQDHIRTLRNAFADRSPDPSRRGSGTPSATPSGPPSDTPDEGGPKGSTRGRAPTHVRAAPAPAPTPAPIPSPVEEGGGCGSTYNLAPAPMIATPPDGDAPIDIDGFAISDGMRRWAHRDGYAPLVDLDYETAQFVSHYRANGQRRTNWADEWQKWIRRAHKWTVERQQQKTTSNVIQLPNGQTLTGTDAKVAAHSALTEQLRALENRESS
ncbi:hypothetical protein [Streptomyces sp. NPDC059708]|uniref:hypothetical protein n=1 Tax=Streptomyces sp. NPDC059708 TaxID=3346916 RepID=UPI0036CA75E0